MICFASDGFAYPRRSPLLYSGKNRTVKVADKQTLSAVTKILKRSKDARNSVRVTIWQVYEELGFAKDGQMTFNDFLDAPAYDTVRRVRAEVLESMPKKAVKEVKKVAKAVAKEVKKVVAKK